MNKLPVTELAAGLMESTPDGVVLYGMDSNIRFANQRFCELWGLEFDLLLTMTPSALRLHKIAQLAYPEQDSGLIASSTDIKDTLETNYIRLNTGLWYERLMYEHIVDGQCIGHVVQWRDVTRRHNAMISMQHERDLLHQMMDSVPHQIYFKDTQSRFTRVNKALASRYGLSDPRDAVGKSDADFYSAEHALQTRNEELEVMRTLKPQLNHMHHETWSDGTESWNVSTKMPLIDSKGNVLGVYGIAHDISEHKRSEAEYWKQANFDSLTNLPNRRLLQDRWEKAIQNHRRSGKSIALMVIDLDHFKEVNDTKGHTAGDRLLSQAAHRMLECLRGSDTLSRLGGDEFAAIITDISEKETAAQVAQKILLCLGNTFHLMGAEVQISGSIGISLYPSDSDSFTPLLTQADQAMYQVKKQGGNGYSFYKTSD